ncbi:hypothetical protein B0H67DRAFT_636535 [Lasiosphaeris hirsuta]|uniref:NmrA-like domain-containing protein n=1 Tax=Lasiosphaeris hirsuta TaxID=260670 RepID=A0AA40A1X0_9PEZI|nr:hypothetical protein B0H67DRAFT_636535 [Lasiosphaeris hirsuta]
MAQRFPSVALIGASGNLGPALLQALREAQPPFESITILTRAPPTNPGAFLSDVQVKVVDYASAESVAAALAGVDAIVSSVPARSVAAQKIIIDAAISAGVKFIVPSEFGLASSDEKLNTDFENWRGKHEVQKYLSGLRADGKIDYALLFTGLFLDWGMEGTHGILLDPKNKRVQLWDGGNTPISFTTVRSIGKSVVGVLGGKAAGKTEVRVKDINLTQRRVYELATKVVGEEGWHVTEFDTIQGVAAAKENIKNGKPDFTMAFLKRAVAVGGYGSLWDTEEDDSQSLGLREWTEQDVTDLITRLVK